MEPASAPQRSIGRYRVTGVLGSGAMGEVLRARDERLGRDVAIKRVKNLLGMHASLFHQRFEAEARALAALAHPAVVQVFDLGVDGDAPFLVMELVEGPTLRSVVREGGPLPTADVRVLGIQLARALEAAHARGIVHRDVKPGNVLRGPGGAWKLADFGVAHVPDSDATISGQFLGTPAYAAPEALTLGQFSPASDVFGLAATLFEAATGAKPRGDATMAELIVQADRPVIDPSAIPPALGALGPVIAAGLALSPAARPDAATFAELLAGAAASPAETSPPAADATAGMVGAASAGAAAAMASAAAVSSSTQTGAPSPARATSASTVSVIPFRVPRWALVVAGVILLIGVIALIDSLGGSGASRGSLVTPSAGPGGRAGGGGWSAGGGAVDRAQPLKFAAPAGLDEKGVRDWRKVADKVRDGNYGEALHKLRDFERKRGESVETARLRAWLEEQPDRFED